MKREPEFSSLSSFTRAYVRQMQRYVTTGVMVWVPLFITIWISWIFVSKITQAIKFSMGHVESYVNRVGARVPSLGFLEHFRLDSPNASMKLVVSCGACTPGMPSAVDVIAAPEA